MTCVDGLLTAATVPQETGNRYIKAYVKEISRSISEYRKDKQDILKFDLQSFIIEAQLTDQNIVKSIFNKIAERLISDNTSFCACVLRKRNIDNNQLDVVAKSPGADSDDFWEGWSNENIIPIDNQSPSSNDYSPVFIKMSDDGYSYFGNNSEWAKSKELKSYSRYFLLSKNEQVIGSLSVYTKYPYDFHQSCKIFLNEIARFLSDFIYRVDSANQFAKGFRTLEQQPEEDIPAQCVPYVQRKIAVASEYHHKIVQPYDDKIMYSDNIG